MQKKTTIEILVVVLALLIVGGIIYIGIQKNKGQLSELGVDEEGALVGEVVEGTSPVSDAGQVLTPEGEPVKLDVEPGSPEAPRQSAPITEPEELPASVKNISASAAGFTPTEFEVSADRAVSLSVTSTDTQSHIFKFDDPKLSAVAVGVGPGETRVITFNAPAKGEYTFYCDVLGHKAGGEVGKMVVK